MIYTAENFPFNKKFDFVVHAEHWTIKDLHVDNETSIESLKGGAWLYRGDVLIGRIKFSKVGIRWSDIVLNKEVMGTIPFNKIVFQESKKEAANEK